jgi:hypothetical protein
MTTHDGSPGGRTLRDLFSAVRCVTSGGRDNEACLRLRLDGNGCCELRASHAQWLYAFPWFRLSVGPFVPDIEVIPEQERAYYETYLLATCNNPARVDLNNYAANFGELPENKIRLMELHAGDEPHLDPDFIWRIPHMSH